MKHMRLRVVITFVIYTLVSWTFGSTAAEEQPAPGIRFDQTVFDFGHVGCGEATVKHQFSVRNVGKADLNIYETRSSCSCTVTRISKPKLEPNETGYIEVTLALQEISLLEKSGLVEQSIFVRSNDPQNSVVTLTLRGGRERNHFYYPSAIFLGPVYVKDSDKGTLYYLPRTDSVPKCQPSVRTSVDFLEARIEKRFFDKFPLPVTLRNLAGDFTFALSDSAYPREGYVVTVTLLPSAPAGKFFQYVVIDTGDQIEPNLMIRTYADVREPLQVTPRRLFLGLVNSDEELRRTITIKTPNRQPFRITSVASEIDFITADVRQVLPSEWRIDMGVKRETFRVGDFRGHIIVLTEFPTMEQFTIGVYGRAKDPDRNAKRGERKGIVETSTPMASKTSD